MRIAYNNLLTDDTTITVSSYEDGSLISDLYSNYLSDKFRFTGKDSENVTIDAGVGNTFDVNTIGIAGHNFTDSAVVKLYADNENLENIGMNIIDSTIQTITMFYYDSILYLGAQDGKFYKYDGTAFTLLTTIAYSISSIAEYGGDIYFSATSSPSIYKYDGATVSTIAHGMGGSNSLQKLYSYSGKLYIGTIGGGELWSYNGTTFTQIVTGLIGIYSMVEYDSILYIGTTLSSGLYQYNGTTFSFVTSFSDSTIRSLCVYDGKMYIGTSSNAKLFSYDGVSFVQIVHGLSIISLSAMSVFKNNLYIGGTGSTEYYLISSYDGVSFIEIDTTSAQGVVSMIGTADKLFLNTNLTTNFKLLTYNTGVYSETISIDINNVIFHTLSSILQYRYFQISIVDTTNTENLEIGALFFGEYVQFPGIRPNIPIKYIPTGNRRETLTGQISGTTFYCRREIDLELPNMSDTQRKALANIWKTVYNYNPIFAVLWEGNPDLEPPIYCVFEVDSFEFNKIRSGMNRYSLPFTIREVF